VVAAAEVAVTTVILGFRTKRAVVEEALVLTPVASSRLRRVITYQLSLAVGVSVVVVIVVSPLVLMAVMEDPGGQAKSMTAYRC
jgi:hypothetical protein